MTRTPHAPHHHSHAIENRFATTAMTSTTTTDAFANSEYGSDFSDDEVDIVNQLLETLTAARTTSGTTLPQDADPCRSPTSPISALADEVSARPQSQLAKGLRSLAKRACPPSDVYDLQSGHHRSPGFVHDSHLSKNLPSRNADLMPPSEAVAAAEDGDPSSRRSPLERFRTFPKKPLTVTDLSSGAWCELQYAYVLTRLPGGRKTRTAAMKGGSAVHQRLEDQIHTAVRVSVSRKEEAFGLRMWNVIQGLRTLRDTGLTRELEVWGTIDDQVVNGVVDELNFRCPADDLEIQPPDTTSGKALMHQNRTQPSISTYFEPHRRLVYLLDVKTRASTKLPSGAALRPTKMQLFLYHRLLCNMAAGKLDMTAVIARYGLEPEARFSDTFMAQVGSLHDDIFDEWDSSKDETPEPEEDHSSARAGSDPTPDLLPDGPLDTDFIKYRCLSQLVPLLQEEINQTFPQGSTNIADLLAVQYRHRDDDRIVGVTSFLNDDRLLDDYISKNMQWWQGRREAEGVPIEETYKCNYCEFAESCQWRLDKEKEIYDKKRERAVASRGG